ncbi:polymerase nucleotidyl transferase domain protein [Fadolivirus algeromassiliense]|jgi:predicted nucleotidyltransferase|uniref:Polymerase nucleotidyl transferase domain protein n=1 Tax=Fadolivirus FV1/VV64 TaxID=3070911 RepID=A0A7D3R113_9VIRU|nr:polymerase nucleotidyl transferase domain protein [Fadolivirus algeromassiliense]QKF93478.1 polymerase nucleotidyl transferase domain protein [Fadolivirus FV1/VV64]
MDKIQNIRDWLTVQYDNKVVYAILYGSHVYGTATAESDLDLYVVLENDIDVEDDTISFNHPTLGRIDITPITESDFLQDLKNNDVKAIEAIFVPSTFVIEGDQTVYQNIFKAVGPLLRHSYGEICRHAWHRGVQKLTKELEEKEYRIGKKSLYHTIRLFICANQVYTTGKLSFDNPRLQESLDFYNSIKDKPVNEIVENGKLKKEYLDLYKKYDKEFKQIPNEEQYNQIMKKIVKK